MRSSADALSRFVFILAESELELVPREILSEKCIVAYTRSKGKKASNILLDASYHHSAMRKLPDGERRGRPDIAHFFLLLCLDSRLNRLGRLRTVVHTRNDERILISPDTRLPPSHHRFIGLFENLFQNAAVPSKEHPLISIESGWTLADILRSEKCDRNLLFDIDGKEMNPLDALMERASATTAIVIGGFPSGSLRADLSGLAVERISLGKELLKVWTVTSEMLSAAHATATAP